ncbi:MAG: hypothetical protein LBH44_10800 [Treponema sp.]|jgi:hypothetical protein|nr:hypothetical protein [Treponema sp.]
MTPKILISEAEGQTAVCFDTGLVPRAFARTKLSQCFNDPGTIICPDGSKKTWIASGVTELDGFMRVWGPLFNGERLDLLIEEEQDKALQAVIHWIHGKLLLGETQTSIDPGAAFVVCGDNTETKGSVLFFPEHLSHRCLIAEEKEHSPYLCPDLDDMEAAAFCAGAMLYRILAATAPYFDPIDFFQDMREGVFTPLNFAATGIDEKISELVNAALLLPVERKRPIESGTVILDSLLKYLLEKGGKTPAVSSFFRPLSPEEAKTLAAEKERFQKRNNFKVKTKRFAMRNRKVLYAIGAAVIFMLFVFWNVMANRMGLPTTKGLDAYSVVYSYYDAFSALNHIYMEACIKGADKSDVEIVLNYYIIDKARQAHEMRISPSIIQAQVWKERGGELPAPNVFGITDMNLVQVSGNEQDNQVQYRAQYMLWFPNDQAFSSRTDNLTLTRRRGNWQITNINRIEKLEYR